MTYLAVTPRADPWRGRLAMAEAVPAVSDHCVCGRLHPCELHGLAAIAAAQRPPPRDVQLSLFVRPA